MRILMNPNLVVICKEEHDEVEILDIYYRMVMLEKKMRLI